MNAVNRLILLHMNNPTEFTSLSSIMTQEQQWEHDNSNGWLNSNWFDWLSCLPLSYKRPNILYRNEKSGNYLD
jgi:hypothetical protein